MRCPYSCGVFLAICCSVQLVDVVMLLYGLFPIAYKWPIQHVPSLTQLLNFPGGQPSAGSLN